MREIVKAIAYECNYKNFKKDTDKDGDPIYDWGEAAFEHKDFFCGAKAPHSGDAAQPRNPQCHGGRSPEYPAYLHQKKRTSQRRQFVRKLPPLGLL